MHGLRPGNKKESNVNYKPHLVQAPTSHGSRSWETANSYKPQPCQQCRAGVPRFARAVSRRARLCIGAYTLAQWTVQALDVGTPEAAEQSEHLLSLAVAAWPHNAKFLLALANCVCFKRKDPERALYWWVAVCVCMCVFACTCACVCC